MVGNFEDTVFYEWNPSSKCFRQSCWKNMLIKIFLDKAEFLKIQSYKIAYNFNNLNDDPR